MHPVSVVVEWENANLYPSDAAVMNIERLAGQVAAASARWHARTPFVIVYDPTKSNSEGARHLCERLTAAHGNAIDVRPLELEGGGYTDQKIAGIHAAPADIYVFADCDCKYGDDWFESILAPVLAGDAEYAYGRNIMDTSTIWGLAAAVFWFYPLEADVPNGPREPYFSNLAVRRTAYARYPFFGNPGHREACAMWSSTVQRTDLKGQRLLLKALHPPPAENLTDLLTHARIYGRIDDALASARGRGRAARIGLVLSRMFWRLIRIPARLIRVARLERARPRQIVAMAGLSVLYILTTTLSRFGWALTSTHKTPERDPNAGSLLAVQN